jgi:hypothetical protein
MLWRDCFLLCQSPQLSKIAKPVVFLQTLEASLRNQRSFPPPGLRQGNV